MTRFPRVRDVLNKLRWGYSDDTVIAGIWEPGVPELELAILTVQDRVSGTKEIGGSSIIRLGKREFDIRNEDDKTTTIPYYKVIKIVLGDEVIWESTMEEKLRILNRRGKT